MSEISPPPVDLPAEAKPVQRPWLSKRGFVGMAIIAISILLCLWYSPRARPVLSLSNPTINLDQERKDNDSRMIYDSIEARKSFGDTFQWYHESWTFDMPFWRPLTMQSYWLQKLAFGEAHSLNWMRVSAVLYAVMLALLASLVYRLSSRIDLSVFAVAIMAIPRPKLSLIPQPYFETPGYHVIYHWKDQPDLYANIFILAAILLALNRKWFWSLACCAAAIGFKEVGWISFPMVAVALLWDRSFSQVPKRFYGVLVVVIVGLLWLRWISGPDVFHGFSMGQNREKYWRYFNMEVPSEIWRNTQHLGFSILGIGFFVVIAWKRWTLLPRFLLATAIAVLTAFIESLQQHVPPTTAFSGLFVWDTGYLMIAYSSFIWCLLFYLLLRNVPVRTPAILGVLLAAIASLVGLSAPQASNPHCLVLPRMFESLFVAAMFLAFWEALSALSRRMKPGLPGQSAPATQAGP